jgi:cyclophilin family peptidyl-prolyl cis-trans isomerase
MSLHKQARSSFGPRAWAVGLVIVGVVLAGMFGVALARQGSPAAGTTEVGFDCWPAAARATPSTEGGMPGKQYTQAPEMKVDPAKQYTGTINTNFGPIEFELYPEDAPQTVNNFVCLAADGYYDNTPFHRIVKGFVIQGGDPTGTGTGGPGYRFNDEPVSKDYEKGILAMANAGPNTNGSQFFIVLEDLRGRLPKNYTIFGKVTGGQDAVDAIAAVPTQRGASGENSTPTEPVTLESVTIVEQ